MLGLYSVMLFGVLDEVVPLLAASVTCCVSHFWMARAVNTQDDPFTQHLQVNIDFMDISKYSYNKSLCCY